MTKTITIRVDSKEKELLIKLSESKGMNISEYIRSKIFDYQNISNKELIESYKKKDDKEIAQLINELKSDLKKEGEKNSLYLSKIYKLIHINTKISINDIDEEWCEELKKNAKNSDETLSNKNDIN